MRISILVGTALISLCSFLVPSIAMADGIFDRVLPSAGEEGERWLGEALFMDPRLSSTGTVSCATCHDPEKSFVDLLPQSIGEQGHFVGRNSPTLFAIGEHDAFVDPLRTSLSVFAQLRIQIDSNGEPETEATAISLAERCLSPLGNAAEMGADIDATVTGFRERTLSDALFDRVFGAPGGVTRERVGEALASYLRTIEPPAEAPYARFLAGDTDALGEAEQRGLSVFSGKGACASCHAGSSLRDGRVHATRHPLGMVGGGLQRVNVGSPSLELNGVFVNGPRPVPQLQLDEEAGEDGEPVAQQVLILDDVQTGSTDHRAPVFNGFLQINGMRGGSGYGGLADFVSATPTLWDVGRTAPYLGSGAIEDLDSAVVAHIAAMQGLHTAMQSESEAREAAEAVAQAEEQDEAENPLLRQQIAQRMVVLSISDQIEQQLLRVPESLRPVDEVPGLGPTPEELSENELSDLMSFLAALSP